MSHTIGPWMATNGITSEYAIFGADETPVFTIRDGLIPMREDARLITAAPDLLAALINVTGAFSELLLKCGADFDPESSPYIVQSRAAIAKATQS